jgi:serine/threonine protein kinase
MTATAASSCPARIGRYEIVRRIGKSMTDVYLAIDTVENRQAALKLIKSGGDMMTKLVVEAERRGAAIQQGLRAVDPRIVEVYEYGDQDGYFFVAMQYVEGRSLAEVLRSEHAMDPVRAATIALEVCEQLAKFHSWQSTVVHGDIKPANIHLGPNNTVRLLDFGIAKTLRPSGDPTVHQFGSPGYCSPERLTDFRVDQQSDLWAVGATLYEMLAGAPPYQADNTQKLEALIRSRRTPRALSPGCPRSLRAVVSKALSPDPARRYRTARDFQADLQAFLEHRPTRAELETGGRWSPNSTIIAARACLQIATRTVRRAKISIARPLTAVAWFALGMSLYIGGALGYQSLHTRRAPRPPSDADLFRIAGEASLRSSDWARAEVYLERAAELQADERIKGELALARGYATLARVSSGMYAESAARQLVDYACDQFALAAEKKIAQPPACPALPPDPEPAPRRRRWR